MNELDAREKLADAIAQADSYLGGTGLNPFMPDEHLRILLAAARSHQSKVPVAWMYTNETGGRLVEMHRWRYGGELKSWTETPLYAAPTAQAMPREPTEAMLDAAYEAGLRGADDSDEEGSESSARAIWKAMYDAASPVEGDTQTEDENG